MADQGTGYPDGNSSSGTIRVLICRIDFAIEARQLFYSDPAVIGGTGCPEMYPLAVGHLAASGGLFLVRPYAQIRR
jgi:hypothetical protein